MMCARCNKPRVSGVHGFLLREVINKVNEIRFTSQDEIHTLGLLCKSMLRAIGATALPPRIVFETLVHRMSDSVRIAARGLILERSSETGGRIQKITGQLIVVAHVIGVDEQVDAVSWRERSHPDIAVREANSPIARFATMTPNGKVFGVGSAVIPANAHRAP